MAVVIRMPEVLTGMSEAILLGWHVSPGDAVTVGQAIAEVETEKATVDLEADQEGVAAGLLVEPGVAIGVGTPILVLAGPGETVAEALAAAGGEPAAAPAPAPVESGAPEPAPVPVAPAPAPQVQERRFVTPLVRRLARERGIDLDTVTGTGPGGRVVRRDLDRHGAAAEVAAQLPPAAPADRAAERPGPAPAAQAPAPPAQTGFTDVPHTGMRRAIARRLTESKNTVPHFYLVAECRVDALLELRRSLKEDGAVAVVPSVNDFVVKAVAAAFREVPEANVIWTEDAVRRFDSVSVAMAVALDDGLVTPVIRDVDRRSLSDVSTAAADLVARAREGRLKQAELEGGSFAISNLGMYGIESFSAIISPPHSGILAVGAASRRAVVDEDGTIRAATMMTVTLSGDHRALDGALAARWLRAFQQIIENPMRILL
ncbi:dihydrolipoamide acetyltransferase family protein [Streptomyces sp. LE64]|uniref:dihydrolipoamide acetyltransferase family protein n=1 Tax=Streptomyces sp. LE64 TaxID=3448653 RepID=UPI004042496D